MKEASVERMLGHGRGTGQGWRDYPKSPGKPMKSFKPMEMDKCDAKISAV